jgi:hypothetical protein
MKRLLLIGTLLLSGCDGESSLQRTARLRNEREAWEAQQARAWEASERAIRLEQERQRGR